MNFIKKYRLILHISVLTFSIFMTILTLDGVTMNLYLYIPLVTLILYSFLISMYFHFERDFKQDCYEN